MSCGDYGTTEVDEIYSVWKPKRGVSYCENCGKWVARKRKPRRKKLPDKPPF